MPAATLPLALRRVRPLAGLLPVAVIAAALLLAAAASLATGGRADTGLGALWRLIAGEADTATGTMRDIRLPRTAVAALIGANLGLAGMILQAITRNPLASPGILGINQGAALGLVVALAFPGATGLAVDGLAICGALGAGAVTFAVAGGFAGRIDPLRLVLGGVAVGAFAYAAVRFAYTLEDDLARSVVRWTVGDIGDMRWPDATRLLPWSLGGLVAAALMAQRLNLMALGDASARGLGADPRWTLFLGALVAAALAGVSVTVTGPVAFVGLVVPHLARGLFGGDHRALVPATAALGAALMLAADAGSKLLAAPAEVPVGLVAALLGAPWFLWLTLTSDELG